jgi:pimeloyl-ACP methyl ester carboxylesterase
MERSVFRLGDISLSVVRSGEGKVFVFQHGLCGAAGQPAEVFSHGLGWQCVTLECRGQGQSEAGNPAQFAIATFADDVAAFVTDLGIGPVVIGGISMGAAIAMRITVRHPELVQALVVARPAWIDARAPENMSPNAEVARLLEAHEPAVALEVFEAGSTARWLASQGPDNLASLRSFFSRSPIAVTRALLASIAADGPGVDRDEIARIACPTLVIGNGLDFIHPIAMAREMARIIPGARLVEITPKAVNIERYRKEFRTALRDFLAELP